MSAHTAWYICIIVGVVVDCLLSVWAIHRLVEKWDRLTDHVKFLYTLTLFFLPGVGPILVLLLLDLGVGLCTTPVVPYLYGAATISPLQPIHVLERWVE
jgi:hypothetical protein